ncbi:ATP-binding cassette sub-family G member 4-like [Contarinia nasturtii]|uniref:ATP-binding cassette sub-family G member 4-like n=1 Tax=Contarinia nasturtii TaxID=265458 RepID=UPI0012D3D5D1|nr:ATP-binding cassette sub-family G member 4-like [Contarinia nasturtii]XP_031623112.1 ATP-binding cassette sub-family G member 4-like [Contarinia nasturtii]XP_031623113.1 ATP-binding cassette sub-family G member 4-like [Contarinia nasturtii]XP_031623114.1 ATP-binding cassette sub-family G member 4-like [Contarinia nasturtii]XP_031623115.1 ATP-binding cassette sub-family G member 4-like [Contarinia nasturtii]XP_031623116.1 ATP-binding cassette sub-family G member 4-like [Contarinia nasturtii]
MPNHTGACSMPIAYIEKDNCKVDAKDNGEDTNNNERLDDDRQCFSETNFGISTSDIVNDGTFDDSVSTEMTKLQVSETPETKRPSYIALKPISELPTKSAGQLDADQTDGCFGANQQESEHDYAKGINIKFQDLIYRARRSLPWDRSTKTIINGVNGEFRAGELTAVMGPSGAGKSTLLHILTGYSTNLASGTITINGRPRDLKRFRSQAAYIMQDHVLQPHITAWEAMYFSVNLKIGSQLNYTEKKQRIQEILEAIGLYENRFTKAGELSGGQRKRLAIALELVDNPQFMAFDEPTSGLDSSTSTQVILLLKHLAQEGRTILCTIHQPSALLFGLFDHLYAIAEGQCIYAGATGKLVPFLSTVGFECPRTYNPSDYLLEISTHDYGPHNDRLVAKIHNGLNENYRTNTHAAAYNYSLEIAERFVEGGLVTPIYAPELAPLDSESSVSSPMDQSSNWKKARPISLYSNSRQCCRCRSGAYATSFFRQWYLLTLRTIICLRRDRTLATMRFIIHALIALLVGTLYFNIGNDATMMFNIFRYIFLSLMFLMFTAFSTVTIKFPLEMPIVAREHFNRWYSKKAYYFALTFADLPVQFACVLIYVLITYLMTAQPLEMFRIGLFLITTVMVTLIAQAFGMIVGASCGVKLGVIVGPFVISPFVVFSGFFLRLADAPTYLHWLFHASFLKYAVDGSTLAIFGYDRPKLECNEIYCHYRIPHKFMKLIDTHQSNFMFSFGILLAICIVLRIIAFFIMSLRLRRR